MVLHNISVRDLVIAAVSSFFFDKCVLGGALHAKLSVIRKHVRARAFHASLNLRLRLRREYDKCLHYDVRSGAFSWLSLPLLTSQKVARTSWKCSAHA